MIYYVHTKFRPILKWSLFCVRKDPYYVSMLCVIDIMCLLVVSLLLFPLLIYVHLCWCVFKNILITVIFNRNVSFYNHDIIIIIYMYDFFLFYHL